jgi:hypothetical protein
MPLTPAHEAWRISWGVDSATLIPAKRCLVDLGGGLIAARIRAFPSDRSF